MCTTCSTCAAARVWLWALAKANGCAEKAQTDLVDFVNERWHGMYPVGWGDTLSEGQLTSMIYEGICGLDAYNTKSQEG